RAFATKPALARQMLERTRTSGVAMAWITGDAIYGDDRALRQSLEAHRQAYVLAVSGKESVWLPQHQRRIRTLPAALPAEGWERLSAGTGSKGPRWYDWLRLDASAPAQGAGSAGCCSAAAARIRWREQPILPMPQQRRSWRIWCAWLGGGGRSKKVSKHR